MSQEDQSVANADGASVRADINANLVALVTLASGAAAPGTTWAGMFWYDTTTGTIKQRNAANSAWIHKWKLANADGTFGANILMDADATYDIGASGANRPRDAFLSRHLTLGGAVTSSDNKITLTGAQVVLSASNTWTTIIAAPINGLYIFRDQTNGQMALYMVDSGLSTVSSVKNDIGNGFAVRVSGGNLQVEITSGHPVTISCSRWMTAF